VRTKWVSEQQAKTRYLAMDNQIFEDRFYTQDGSTGQQN